MTIKLNLGVTGLRRTGKTVFLTALIHQLLQRGSEKMWALDQKHPFFPATELKLPPELTRFDYETHLQSLQQSSAWPHPTMNESFFRVEFEYKPERRTWRNAATRLTKHVLQRNHVQLTLHDYPGEFLLDAPLLQIPYLAWSMRTWQSMQKTFLPEAKDYFDYAQYANADSSNPLPTLRLKYATYLIAARRIGLEHLQPAMSLLQESGSEWELLTPEQLADEKHLPFIPLPPTATAWGALQPTMEAAYDTYRTARVRPFARRLSQVNVQLVLVDLLRVFQNGTIAVNDLVDCLVEVLRAYTYRSIWRSGIHKVLFAATKADHVLKMHRPNLSALLEQSVGKAIAQIGGRADLRDYLAFTTIRATEDALKNVDGGTEIEVLKGVRKGAADHEPKGHIPGILPPSWPPDLNSRLQTSPFPEFELLNPFPSIQFAEWNHLNFDKVLAGILT